jgi:calcineurin-like phosphoesterase family protein
MPVPAPGRILVAGDWHGNTRWAQHVIGEAGALLADEEQRIILHLGDFGIWPGLDGTLYLNGVLGACLAHDVQVLFVDGNHEDFTRIEDFRIRDGQLVSWLPRGYRWEWHGRTWLALGGGVSLDKAIRTEGRDWWPQEEITSAQAWDVITAGPADVMVTHDCPGGVVHAFPPPPPFWDLRDMARSAAHRERLQRVVDVVRPSHLLHGHLHIGYQRTADFGYGPVEITGLDRDGEKWNYAILDTRTMEWEIPER